MINRINVGAFLELHGVSNGAKKKKTKYRMGLEGKKRQKGIKQSGLETKGNIKRSLVYKSDNVFEQRLALKLKKRF